MKKSVFVVLLILFVLFIDQASKIYIKMNFSYGETVHVLSWAKLHFVENPGMAFGIEFGGEYGKIALSLFRVVMIGLLGYYIRFLLKQGVSWGLLTCFAFIFAGALGNILDSAFYGMVFSDSGRVPAEYLGFGNGYASAENMGGFLYGKVVDMLHFPMMEGFFPEWLPKWGGKHFLFFRPVFNIADSSIFVGVLSLLLFQREFFTKEG